MRTPLLLATAAAVALAIAPVRADSAHPTKTPPRSEPVSLNGEIIDPQCYFTHGSRGPAHASCATLCAKGGQGLAFLDDATGTVYPLIAKSHGASQNEGLIPHLGKLVRVKGIVYRKADNAVLLVQSVTPGAATTK